MTSPGLLLLMLVSSSLLSTVSTDLMDRIQEALDFTFEGLDMANTVVGPFLGMIPVHGELIKFITDYFMGLLPKGQKDKAVLDALKAGFESIHKKLDKYQAQMKWEVWSTQFSQPERDIKLAWKKFVNLVSDKSSAVQREKLRNEFIDKYPVDATETLYSYLTADGKTTMSGKLRPMLMEHVNCHEQELIPYIVLINTLMYQGSLMTLFYYKEKGLGTKNNIKTLTQNAFDSAKALFDMHKSCIEDSEKYVKKDVEELVKKTKKRQNLAHEIRAFLTEKYSRYDWMVVVYLTKHSDSTKVKSLNQHTLSSEFFTVEKDGVSVGLTRQVRGKHTMVDKVRRAIERCIPKPKTVDCHKIAKLLDACKEKVDKIPVTKTYTAVHAYLDKSHQSVDASVATSRYVGAKDEKTPYIHKGICKKHKVAVWINFGGEFVVLIKSDEEIMNQKPCDKLKCGGDKKGKCVEVKDTRVTMCDCKGQSYGQNCELDISKYRSDMEKFFKDDSKNVPGNKKPSNNKPSNLKPSNKKPSNKKPSNKKPSNKKPSNKKPSNKKPSNKKPSNKKPSNKKPSKPNKKSG